MIRQGMAVAFATLAISGCGQPVAKTETAPPAQAVATGGRVAPAPAQGAANETATLGVTFESGPGLTIGPCEGDTPRCVAVSDPAAEPFMRELFVVQVHEKPLDIVAAEEAGFVRDADGRLMTTYGRFEPVPVEPFTVHGNPGLRATITCGTSDPETGFHAAAGECLYAVISDGARSVIIATGGYENAIEPANAAIASIRFLPRP